MIAQSTKRATKKMTSYVLLLIICIFYTLHIEFNGALFAPSSTIHVRFPHSEQGTGILQPIVPVITMTTYLQALLLLDTAEMVSYRAHRNE